MHGESVPIIRASFALTRGVVSRLQSTLCCKRPKRFSCRLRVKDRRCGAVRAISISRRTNRLRARHVADVEHAWSGEACALGRPRLNAKGPRAFYADAHIAQHAAPRDRSDGWSVVPADGRSGRADQRTPPGLSVQSTFSACDTIVAQAMRAVEFMSDVNFARFRASEIIRVRRRALLLQIENDYLSLTTPSNFYEIESKVTFSFTSSVATLFAINLVG